MTLLDQIDFLHHDGVNRPMINDFMRNQFYDNIFVESVKDKHCIDIGFGTGLLSILALKHGAKSIIAYECDKARHELGQMIIQKLGLKQITLLNEKYNYHMLPEQTEVVFSETVNGNLWQEGLFYSLPRQPGMDFLPGQYYLEIYACEVPDVFAQGLANPQVTSGFTLGVDIDNNFVDLINQIGFNQSSINHQSLSNEIYSLDTGMDTEWGWIPYLRLCVNNGKLVAGYCVDAKTASIKFVNGQQLPFDFDWRTLQLTVDTGPWKNKSVIIVPRAGMRHGQHQLMLDTGHWGPTLSPVILSRPQRQLTVTHNLLSGDIIYTNE